MVQGTPQFTPAQVLEAGRRAEAEGKLDYAVQFFRHLATHYPNTSEAQAAREGLHRLAPHHASAGAALAGLSQRAGEAPPPIQPSLHNPPTGGRGPHVNGSADSVIVAGGPAGIGGGHMNGPVQAPGMPPLQARAPQGGPPPPPRGAAHDAGHPRAVARSVEVAIPADRYRTGRWLSRLFTVIGFAMALVGLAILLLAMTGGMMPRIVERLGTAGMMAFAFGYYIGPGLLGFGLTLAHWGQFARAAFDASMAGQTLVALERAKIER